jgi:hypothetical protein
MSRTNHSAPKARSEQLVIKELGDETLVYDEHSHEAHCLNRTAALVWRHCDGRTSAAKMAGLLSKEAGAPVSEQVVWLALGQLERSRLLEEPPARPARAEQVSRRELMRRLGVAAAFALPLVTSIVAPTPAEAQSKCAGPCESCEILPCCGDLSCDGICFPCEG